MSKTDYRNFLYAKFIDKYVKDGKNLTLLEKVFKIDSNIFWRIYGSGVTVLSFPAYDVTKKTGKIITQKIGDIKDFKTKKIYFKTYKKAKKYTKHSEYKHKIRYDKKLKKYYIKGEFTVYSKITSKKAKVYLKLDYHDNMYELTYYTKYDSLYWLYQEIVRDYTIYKSAKTIQKLHKSKTKKNYLH